MPVTVSYPGVYLEEDASLSLSISAGATAVPVFPTFEIPTLTAPLRINSWLDYMDLFVLKYGFSINPPHMKKVDLFGLLNRSIKTYFENGGGYCYLVPFDKLGVWVPTLDDVTLLVMAGNPKAMEPMSNLAKDLKLGLFAVLDGPYPSITDFTIPPPPVDAAEGDPFKWTQYGVTPHAAIYYPWLTADWAGETTNDDGKVIPNAIPPSAAVAGAMCRVDRERGVWKAAANVPLNGGVKPVLTVTDVDQGQYTGEGNNAVNMIRSFTGKGTLIWGARTLAAGADVDRWRYIPVRRLFNSVERDIKKAMKIAVFELNSAPTWETVRSAIDIYLHALWKKGALKGNTAQEAYFVQVGLGTTMTETDIKQGILRVKVGMAAVRPAEFIILQFTQEVQKV